MGTVPIIMGGCNGDGSYYNGWLGTGLKDLSPTIKHRPREEET